jgi:chemosensory pili system protein ChpA (sensor histidine kinase/response regulator)
VNALGGRIESSTREGAGTTFKLVLPLTTAVTQVVMLRVGDFTVGVPSGLVETVLRTPAATLEQAYLRDGFEIGGQTIPFFWAGALLQVSAQSNEAQTKTRSVAVFRSAGQRLAMHVDEILGNREVVVKNLGPQLAQLPGLAGVSVLASGAVALIYNPVALAAVYGAQARQLHQSAVVAAQTGKTQDDATAVVMSTGSANQVPLILVVDDSITVRRVTQRLLKREGYRVALASDGLDALERLAEEKPTVVLSDIEMPRMDGFDLARNIRGDANLRDLPIIMITSRIAGKHRDHAKELGVDHYLGKPYSEDELLGLVRSYCASVAEV